jgi:hypothetical protein
MTALVTKVFNCEKYAAVIRILDFKNVSTQFKRRFFRFLPMADRLDV